MGHLLKKQKTKKVQENQKALKEKYRCHLQFNSKKIVKQQQLYTNIYTTCTNIFPPQTCKLNFKIT